ncbi:MAG: shikimate dehydrogenase [Bacteroidales bacterium]|jgi:shikimate dehydrogenase|nr:shikimate dehydrogenase [Bacteroidales bacterium]
MATLGLLGQNISYSLSPEIFNYLSKKSNVNINYHIFDVQDIMEIQSIISGYDDLVGFNVTIPYKTEIIQYLDNLSPIAAEIAAVNCVVIDENKKLTGYNTDWIAFKITFDRIKKDFHKKALILGSGGAAKAVAYALKHSNIDYLVTSRNSDNFKYMLFENKIISYDDLIYLDFNEYNIIINTTPCGTIGNTCDLSDLFPFELIKENSLMYDLVYNTNVTLFIQKGIDKKCFTKNGEDMLILQATIMWQDYFLPLLK